MNKSKDFVMPAVVLMAICLFTTVALVFTYQYTQPFIEAAALAEADAARKEVFTGEYTFTAFDDVEFEPGSAGNVVDAYIATAAGQSEPAGYVITANAKGFNGPVNIMVGFDAEGKITGVKLLEHSETPGLGTKVGEAKFTSQFLDKDTETYTEVDAIAGATISSTAFKRALGVAVEAFNLMKGGAVK